MITRKKVKIIHAFMIMALCAVIVSCSTNTVYHHYLPIKQGGWGKTDTLLFAMPDSMDTGHYDIKIGVRHTADYPYRDLWMSLQTGGTEKPDTIHLYLASRNGNWKSNGASGGYYQYETNVLKLHHKQDSDSIIKVWHIMKEDVLPHIKDIGLKISKE